MKPALTKPAFAFAAIAGVAAACGNSPDARYPARAEGCPVKALPGEPPMPVDELGTVTVECTTTGGACQRQLMDAVCKLGGDVAWGLGDNTLTSLRPVAHAAHTRRVTQGPRERGCAVQVFRDAPVGVHTENIGPVEAICDQNDSEDVCLRELQDQVCLLGGDVVWQVEGPALTGNKQRMRGRAAHSR
jgi:hypothetical protein